jgi:hypothetical protein
MALPSGYQTRYNTADMARAFQHFVQNHLSGRITNYYYDSTAEGEMFYLLLVLPGEYAVVIDRDETDIVGTFYTKSADINRLLDRTNKEYFREAKPRLILDFFHHPNNILTGKNASAGISYTFQEIPLFGLFDDDSWEEFLAKLTISDDERTILREQFAPLFLTTGTLRHFYIYNTDAIDEALDKKRFLSDELSEMLGRKAYVDIKILLAQLDRLREKLQGGRDDAVCFLRRDDFEALPFQVASIGDAVSVFWQERNSSAVTTNPDATTKCALFCHELWRDIPTARRSRVAAERQLAIWRRRTSPGGLLFRGE